MLGRGNALKLLMLAAAVGVFSEPAGGPVRYQRGDWVITGHQSLEASTFVLNGDLIIERGGGLTLRGVTLIIEGSDDQPRSIVARHGSSLTISDSTLRPAQGTPGFRFLAEGAALRIERTRVEGVAGGLVLRRTQGALLEGNTILHPDFGVLLTDSIETRIIDNTFTCLRPGEIGAAVALEASHRALIRGNRFFKQYSAVTLKRSWDNEIVHNQATLTLHTIGFSIYRGSGNNVIAYNDISAENRQDHI